MERTLQTLQELKQDQYDIFMFTEFQSTASTTFSSLFTNHQMPVSNFASFSFDRPRVVSVVSNRCENLYRDSASSVSFDVHNDGLLYFCLKELNQSKFLNSFICREIQPDQATEEALHFMESIRVANQQKNASSLNMVHLHTQLPLTDLDLAVSQSLEQLQSIRDLPILVLVGVQGNRGFSLDSIPVSEQRWSY